MLLQDSEEDGLDEEGTGEEDEEDDAGKTDDNVVITFSFTLAGGISTLALGLSESSVSQVKRS